MSEPYSDLQPFSNQPSRLEKAKKNVLDEIAANSKTYSTNVVCRVDSLSQFKNFVSEHGGDCEWSSHLSSESAFELVDVTLPTNIETWETFFNLPYILDVFIYL